MRRTPWRSARPASAEQREEPQSSWQSFRKALVSCLLCLLSGLAGGLLRLLRRLLCLLFGLIGGLLGLLRGLLRLLLGLLRGLLCLVCRLLGLVCSLLRCLLRSLLGLLRGLLRLLCCLLRRSLCLIRRTLRSLHSLLRGLLCLVGHAAPRSLRNRAGNQAARRRPQLRATAHQTSALRRRHAHPGLQSFGGNLRDGQQAARIPVAHSSVLAPLRLIRRQVGSPVAAGSLGFIVDYAIERCDWRGVHRLRGLKVRRLLGRQRGKSRRGKRNRRQRSARRRGCLDGAILLQLRGGLR